MNVSSETIILTPFPLEIQVKPQDGDEILYQTPIASKRSQMLFPGREIRLVFPWDQKDKEGNQIPPGWYRLVLKELTVTQETTTMRHHLDSYTVSRFLIQYPQGAMEKSLDLNQSETVNGITVTLERVELTSAGMTVYAFNTPLGYTPPQGILPTSRFMVASAECSVDGGMVKQAGLAGFRFLEDGTRYTWKKLDPVPSDARELTFRIKMRYEDKPEELLGPWEFKIPLE